MKTTRSNYPTVKRKDEALAVAALTVMCPIARLANKKTYFDMLNQGTP